MRPTLIVAPALVLAACGPALLEPPANLQVVAGDRANTISWDPVDGADSYRLYWARGSDPTADSEKFKATSPFVHGELENGVTIRYAVAARNASGTGPLSAVVAGTPQAPPAVGTLEVSFKLCCAPEAIGLALWIEREDGTYVDSVAHYRDYARYMDGRMPEWQRARESDLDGVTEASVWPGQERVYTWDGLDRLGAPALQGRYNVRLEVNDRQYPNAVTDKLLDLGSQGFVDTATNANVSGSISYVYQP